MPALVYRCFDADDRLLYIGSTTLPIRERMSHHRSTQRRRRGGQWAAKVARIECDPYPTEAEARAAEMEALWNTSPVYNRHGNGLYALTRTANGRKYLIDAGRVKEIRDLFGIDVRKSATRKKSA